MTASSSNPGKDSELFLPGVFDELAGAGTLDAAVRVAAEAAGELDYALGYARAQRGIIGLEEAP